MSRYRTVYEEVSIDVSLDDWETEELIEELIARGKDPIVDPDLNKAFDWYARGNVEEAMIHLERAYPQFYGLSRKVNCK